MRIGPALAEYARDSNAQAIAQERMTAARAQWLASLGSSFRDAFRRYADGAPLEAIPALAALLDHSQARALLEGWASACLDAMAEAPLGAVPFRHGLTDAMGILHLVREGDVALAVTLHGTQDHPEARTIAFTDCERHEIVVAGRGAGRLLEARDGATLAATQLDLKPGTRLTLDRHHSRIIERVEQPLVILRLSRMPPNPRPTQEIDLSNGRVVHQASATAEEGRVQLAAVLLGAMGRRDAAPVLARKALGDSGDGARWECLRHALALDTATGFDALCAVAECSGDRLGRQAGDLRDALCTRYPELAQYREAQCLVS